MSGHKALPCAAGLRRTDTGIDERASRQGYARRGVFDDGSVSSRRANLAFPPYFHMERPVA